MMSRVYPKTAATTQREVTTNRLSFDMDAANQPLNNNSKAAPSSASKNDGPFTAKLATSFGASLIALSIVSVICNIVWFAFPNDKAQYVFNVTGVGVWGGLVLFVCGILILFFAFKRTSTILLSILVTSIVGILTMFAVLVIGGFQIYYAVVGYRAEPPEHLVDKDLDPTPNGISLSMGVFYVLISLVSLGILLASLLLSVNHSRSLPPDRDTNAPI